jgi:hypothetical protein
MSDIILELRRRLAVKTTDQDDVLRTQPAACASEAAIASDEKSLGFRLPAVLRRVYGEIGNGGFGPGYGLIGVSGGRPDDTGKTLAEVYAINATVDPEDPSWSWPKGLVPICHWGCAIYSCVDCLSPGNPVRIFDPNAHEDSTSWDDALFDEAPSLEQWLREWAAGVDLWVKSYGDDGTIAKALAKRELR